MTTQLIECIPNFSDARRPEVVEQIKQAITEVPGVTLLDQHSDLDHNRTVLTFVGSPQGVEKAAFQAISKAVELIDLEQHSGEHPRIGAADVVPFVPISGVTMQDCIEMAQRVGKRAGEELGIPVYLYEEAATSPARRNLEKIRRGEYEVLKDEIGVKPERKPDYGPSKVGPAGATVIGARQPLIAFNVYLTTDDVGIASKIARAVRHSSGGLRYLKALGMEVEGLAQVSMNLTNFRRTPIFRVVELIRREAARYGVSVDHSELVGLIPQEALVDAAQWYMQLDQFEPEQILEYRLAAAQNENDEVPGKPTQQDLVGADFLNSLSAGTPTPGGGSAAAYSGAAGAALVAMVARLTIGKKKYAGVEEQMKEILERAETLRADLTMAVTLDAQAYNAVMVANKLPKGSPEQQAERSEAIQIATLKAAQVPLGVARMAVEIIELALQVVQHGNIYAISDGAVGAALARAAVSGAGYNVRINTLDLSDEQKASSLLAQLGALDSRVEAASSQIQTLLVERGGLPQG